MAGIIYILDSDIKNKPKSYPKVPPLKKDNYPTLIREHTYSNKEIAKVPPIINKEGDCCGIPEKGFYQTARQRKTLHKLANVSPSEQNTIH